MPDNCNWDFPYFMLESVIGLWGYLICLLINVGYFRQLGYAMQICIHIHDYFVKCILSICLSHFAQQTWFRPTLENACVCFTAISNLKWILMEPLTSRILDSIQFGFYLQMCIFNCHWQLDVNISFWWCNFCYHKPFFAMLYKLSILMRHLKPH